MRLKKLNLDGVRNGYIVGDLHGHYHAFIAKLISIGFDFKRDFVVAVGDLVDRGPNSDLCVDLLNESWFASVKGNHEVMTAESINNHHMNGMHKQHGGGWFYEISKTKQKEIAKKLGGLPLVIEITRKGKKYGVVHADSCEDWNYNIQLKEHKNLIEDHLLWSFDRINSINQGIERAPIANIDHVFFGHSTVRKVTTHKNYTYTDTGHWKWGNGIKLVNIDTLEVL